jgi:gliding motility-associated lipoprotein GldH
MIRRTIKDLRIILLSVLAAASGCSSKVIFSDSAVMPDNIWSLSNIPEFTATIIDTVKTADVLFTIRTGSGYPFRNIWLFVTTDSPDGKSITDTLEYNLADDKGNWYGKGFGDIHELNLPYRKNVFFPRKGPYHFKIQHGMRIGDLKGVYDFGLRIEKYSSNK